MNPTRFLIGAAMAVVAGGSLACTRTVTVAAPSPTSTTSNREAEGDVSARAACLTHTEIDVMADDTSDANDSVAIGRAADAARWSLRWQPLYEALTHQAQTAMYLQAQPKAFFDRPGGNPEINDLGRARITIENECRKLGGFGARR